jgi:epoxide hydrolase-like predicted phosphatase
MIDTLIFDLGNVVLTNDWHDSNQEKFQAYSQYFNIEYDDMEKGWSAAWPQFSVGRITENEFWQIFLASAGAKTINIDKAKELWRKSQKPIGTMLTVLAKLKGTYTLGALTTISKEWLDFKTDMFHLDDYFEAIVSSGYFGKGKPDKEVYELVLSKLHSQPQNSIFIDDTAELLATAERLGMMTILFKDQEQLIDDLRNLKIQI